MLWLWYEMKWNDGKSNFQLSIDDWFKIIRAVQPMLEHHYCLNSNKSAIKWERETDRLKCADKTKTQKAKERRWWRKERNKTISIYKKCHYSIHHHQAHIFMTWQTVLGSLTLCLCVSFWFLFHFFVFFLSLSSFYRSIKENEIKPKWHR